MDVASNIFRLHGAGKSYSCLVSSPFKSIIKHTKGEINIKFFNESLQCISTYLSFKTLWRSEFNTLGEALSLILGHLIFCCKPSPYLCLHRIFKFLYLGHFLGHSVLLGSQHGCEQLLSMYSLLQQC